MDTTDPISDPNLITQRWRMALHQHEPNLPRPIVDAMVQNAMKGLSGEALCQLEEALIQLETFRPDQLTGSEARTWLAILMRLCQQAEQMEASIRQLWNSD